MKFALMMGTFISQKVNGSGICGCRQCSCWIKSLNVNFMISLLQNFEFKKTVLND